MTEKLFAKFKLWHIVVIAIMVYACALNGRLSTAGDDSRYIFISKALLEKCIFKPIFILKFLATNISYFMLPFLLMPFVAISPYLFLPMKLLSLSASICFVIVLYHFLEGIVPPKMQKLVTLLCAVNPWVVEYSNRIMTETLYLLFSMLTLFLMKRYLERSSARFLYFSVLMSMISFYTRPAGIALIATIIIVVALSKRWKDCIMVCILVLVLSTPILLDTNRSIIEPYKAIVQKKDHYVSQYQAVEASQLLRRIGDNFLVYTGNYLPDLLARPLVGLTDPRLPTKKINPLFLVKFSFGIFMSGLIFIGFITSIKNGLKPYHLYAAILFMLNLALNVYVARYLLALLPFLLLWFFSGIEHIGSTGKNAFQRSCGYLRTPFFIFFLAFSIVGTAQEIVFAHTDAMSAKEKTFVECNEWLRVHLPLDAVVVSRKPFYTELITGRKSIRYLFLDDPAQQLEYITGNKARYVIVGDFGFYLNEEKYLIDTAKKYPERFRLLYITKNKPQNYIYEVIY